MWPSFDASGSSRRSGWGWITVAVEKLNFRGFSAIIRRRFEAVEWNSCLLMLSIVLS